MCVYVGQWHAVWSLCIKWCKWHHRVNRSPCSLNMNMSPWNKHERFFMQSEHGYVTMQSQHEHITIYLVNLSQFILWSVCNHEHILLWTCQNLFCEQFLKLTWTWFLGVNMSHLIVCELFTNMMEVTVLKLTNQLQAN